MRNISILTYKFHELQDKMLKYFWDETTNTFYAITEYYELIVMQIVQKKLEVTHIIR